MALFVAGDISLGFWVKFDAAMSLFGLAPTIVQRGMAGTTLDTVHSFLIGHTLFSAPYNITYFHDFGGGGAFQQESTTFGTAIPADTWTYVGFSRDDTAKTVKCYQGTGGASSVTLVGTFTYVNSVDPTGGTNPTCRFSVGYTPNQSAWSLERTALGPMVYYNRALSEVEHTLVMACSPPATGLLLWCKMEFVNPEVDLSPSAWSGAVLNTTEVANPSCLGGGPATPPGGSGALYIGAGQ
jgi:hypothetical protein